MGEKIIFLGTAGTREAVAKNIRSAGGIIIQTGENQFLINPGPGSSLKAKENTVNLRETTSIIATDNDIVNTNDINVVIDAITHAGQDPKSVLLCSESVINGTKESEPTLKKQYIKYLERAITLKPEQKVGINEVEIHTTKTKNDQDETSFGIKLYIPKTTKTGTTHNLVIAYTGNTQYFKGIEEIYEDADILIINLQEPLGEIGSSMNTDDVIKIVNEIKPTLTILTGFGSKLVKADPLFQSREIQKKTQCQIMAAKDGLTIAPTGFKPKTKQQSLKKFEEDEPDIEVGDSEEIDEILEEEKPIEETEEYSDEIKEDEETKEIEEDEELQEVKSINLDEEEKSN